MAWIHFHFLGPDDAALMKLIAGWYLDQWQIPENTTLEKLKMVIADKGQFQVMLMMDGTPAGTAGLYHSVSLVEEESRFSIYRNWLALVYTVPAIRRRGYGAMICDHVSGEAKKLDIEFLYLFTDSAERLYRRLGWTLIERVHMNERNMAVMKKSL